MCSHYSPYWGYSVLYNLKSIRKVLPSNDERTYNVCPKRFNSLSHFCRDVALMCFRVFLYIVLQHLLFYFYTCYTKIAINAF